MFASDYRRLARESLAGNWGPSIVAALIASIFGGLVVGTGFGFDLDLDLDSLEFLQENFPGLMNALKTLLLGSTTINLLHFLMGGVIGLGYCTYLLKQHDRQERSYKDLFSHFEIYGSALCLHLLTGLFVALWTLLFVIPGIVASYRYAMAPFIMAEHPELTARQALNASKQMMQGNKGRLFCLDLSFIGWALLSALTLGIGSLFLNPYVSAARAAFYRSLCDEQKTYREEL